MHFGSSLSHRMTSCWKRICRRSLPVLVITGTEDKIVPPSDAERLAKEIPNAVLVRIEECGHIPHEEKPEEFLSAVLEFLGLQA
ncbi:MAG: alpha/beta fold hydrolase [Candidatus Methanomethylicaceae archaeon]